MILLILAQLVEAPRIPPFTAPSGLSVQQSGLLAALIALITAVTTYLGTRSRLATDAKANASGVEQKRLEVEASGEHKAEQWVREEVTKLIAERDRRIDRLEAEIKELRGEKHATMGQLNEKTLALKMAEKTVIDLSNDLAELTRQRDGHVKTIQNLVRQRDDAVADCRKVHGELDELRRHFNTKLIAAAADQAARGQGVDPR